MNLLQVGYQYSVGATSVDLPVKLTEKSLLLVWYYIFLISGFVVQLVPPLELAGFDFSPSELVGFLQLPLELVGPIFPPPEIGCLAVVIESLVVAMRI